MAALDDSQECTQGTSTPADVRMHGFRQRSEVPAVLAWIDRHARRLGRRDRALEDAAGRVLAAT